LYRILIVDDNLENRQLLAEILRDVAQSDFAASGLEAIEIYNRSLEKEAPYDLILLDIELPGMNGLEILEKIRESEKNAGIPLGDGTLIMIVTAYPKRFVEAYNRGCDDYILKPIDTDILLSKIRTLLEKPR
jgi:two-component system, chemotaxis family, chemotaxis protein CheY